LDIIFDSKKFQKECNQQRLLIKRYGDVMAKRISRRLDDLRAAETLEAMRYIPGRCHELIGNRAGSLSLDLEHPYRLIFEPEHDPLPRKADGGLNWSQVTTIRIIGVEDTHGN
jgi:proteic killer suppression protein